MKKRLTSSSFSALRETATLLDEQEQRSMIGGDYWDDHGIWQLDSYGNMYWTRTSHGWVQYRYFDPQSGDSDWGTKETNLLTLGSDGRLTGDYKHLSGQNTNQCTVTSVRLNQ